MGLFDPLLALLGIDPVVQQARNKAWDGDLDGAIQLVRGRIEEKGPSPMRMNSLAWFLIEKGRAADALQAADQAVGLQPSNAEWQATKGRALRRLGRVDEALPLMQRQFEKNKMDIFNSSELCELLLQMGKPQDAVAVYRDMTSRFGNEVNTPLAKRIGMSAAYLGAQQELRNSGLA